jgi:hypothetical protein
MVKLDKFQKHIVLYCKGQYNIPEGEKGFFEGLKMIWAIRCGYDYEYTSKDTLTYIANDMFSIIMTCKPEKLEFFMDKIHREINPISNWTKPKDLTPIEAIIWEYRSILSNMQVREKVGDEWKWLIDLEGEQPEIFNRILEGKGEYKDYEKIK